MKLYIFQETGEFRVAEDGEWYRDINDDFIQADGPTYVERKIVHKIEIEIPDKTDKTTQHRMGCESPVGFFYYPSPIPIIRPKSKIKKWQYLWQYGDSPTHYITPLPYATWEDALKYITVIYDYIGNLVPIILIERIENSMIEVEE
jgi:hypothetical protein